MIKAAPLSREKKKLPSFLLLRPNDHFVGSNSEITATSEPSEHRRVIELGASYIDFNLANVELGDIEKRNRGRRRTRAAEYLAVIDERRLRVRRRRENAVVYGVCAEAEAEAVATASHLPGESSSRGRLLVLHRKDFVRVLRVSSSSSSFSLWGLFVSSLQ